MQSLTQNILHKVVLWAERHSSEIIRFGSKLNAEEISIARAAGVANPDQIRIMFVEQIPCPDDPELLELIIKYDLFGTNTAGLTIGYGIYIRNGCTEILGHEFRHVYQYEQAGSIESFLSEYIQQIYEYGYRNATLEVDARNICEIFKTDYKR